MPAPLVPPVGFCHQCGGSIPNPEVRCYCSDACRQRAYRQRRQRGEVGTLAPLPRRVANPEYLEMQRKLRRRVRRRKGD